MHRLGAVFSFTSEPSLVIRFFFVAGLSVMGFVGIPLCDPLVADEPSGRATVGGDRPRRLMSDALTESSGLAFSHVQPDCVWSHNDSGGKPRLYAFANDGKWIGGARLIGAEAIDWEDMASFVDEVPRLLVADVGDNQSERPTVTLYLFDEPPPDRQTDIESFVRIDVRYPEGSRNCESVCVDVANRRILLLSKSVAIASLHSLPLPPRDSRNGSLRLSEIAQRIGSVAVPLATAMDLCPKTGDLWVTGYWQAFQFPSSVAKSVEARLKHLPRPFDLPKLRQIEAVAVNAEGNVWVTSEGKPTPMQRVVTSP